MDINGLKMKVKEFSAVSDDACFLLTKIKDQLSEHGIPEKTEIEALNTCFTKLRQDYESIAEMAKDQLSAEELPPEGSSVDTYMAAVENSSRLMIRAQLEQAAKVLKRFTRIRTRLPEYEKELKPYQDIAVELLKNLTEDNINDILQTADTSEAVLSAIGSDIFSKSEGYELLGKINKHFPAPVAWGLAAHQYYIDDEVADAEGSVATTTEDTADTLPKPDTVEVSIESETAEANVALEPEIQAAEAACSEIVLDMMVADNAETVVGNEKADAEDKTALESAPAEDMISPVNRVRIGTPSATSFKKEIIKMVKLYPEARNVFPMLTNLGALTQEQAYLFGVCMTCGHETDEYRNSVETAIDFLTQKGYLACFSYKNGDHIEKAYCLTEYSYNCLKKESISSQMKGFWSLSFGKYRFTSSGPISRRSLTRAVSRNERLVHYVYSMRNTLDADLFADLMLSIRLVDDHYHVKVVYNEVIYDCVMLNGEEDLDVYYGADELYCLEGNRRPLHVNDDVDSLFIFSPAGIEKFGAELVKDMDEGAEQEEEFLSGAAFDEGTAGSEDEITDAADQENGPEYEDSLSADEDDINSAAAENDMTESALPPEAADTSTLLSAGTAPSDDEFCRIINSLLCRPAPTRDRLRSVIVQSVLFANGAGLEKDRPKSSKLAAQLKLATHLLLDEVPYSSEHLASAFDDPDTDDPVLMLAAYLFAMLTPSVAFDFGLKNQTEAFFSNYDFYFDGLDAFKSLFNKLRSVQDINATGFTPAVISMLGSQAECEAFIGELRRQANNYLVVPSPKVRLKALPALYSKCFGQGSDLHECMKIIANDRKEPDNQEFIKEVLSDYCASMGDAFSIDMDKVEEHLAGEWDILNGKNTFKLEYDAHDQAIRQFTSRLELILAWNEQIDSLNRKKEEIPRLRKLKSDIVTLCSDIQKDASWKKVSNANVLSWLLAYMKGYLNGEKSRLHIFSELLMTGIISLDDGGNPVINPAMADIRYYEPWRNALRHIILATDKIPFDNVKADILGDYINGTDEDAGNKDNLHQLQMIGKLLENRDEDYIVTEAQQKEAVDSANERMVRFKETLELAYTYNQINEDEKETLSDIMTRFRGDFYSLMDFASWRRFLDALEMQIKEYAESRKSELRKRLDLYLKKDPDSTLLKEADTLLEKDMNLAVAEEYLNRYVAGEVELNNTVDFMHENNYYEEFLKKDFFDGVLQECRRNNGRAVRSFGWQCVEKRIPKDWTSRLRDDSRTMVNCWPVQKNRTNTDQIKMLFTCLGF